MKKHLRRDKRKQNHQIKLEDAKVDNMTTICATTQLKQPSSIERMYFHHIVSVLHTWISMRHEKKWGAQVFLMDGQPKDPDAPLGDYLEDLCNTFFQGNMCGVLFAFILLSRVKLPIYEQTIRRMFFIALIVAAKFLNDIPYNNTTWVSYQNTFSLTDVNAMELEFLKALNFSVFVSSSTMKLMINLLRAVDPQRWVDSEEYRRETYTEFTRSIK